MRVSLRLSLLFGFSNAKTAQAQTSTKTSWKNYNTPDHLSVVCLACSDATFHASGVIAFART